MGSGVSVPVAPTPWSAIYARYENDITEMELFSLLNEELFCAPLFQAQTILCTSLFVRNDYLHLSF